MRRFLSSAWFPFLMCLVLAGVSTAAFAILKPTGEGLTNSQLVIAMGIAGWAIGLVAGLLAFLTICILNLLRRIVRLRKNGPGHPIVVLLGIVPWLVFAWVLTDEPRYTQFAIGMIEYVGRPLLWGTLVATLLSILLSIPLFVSAKK